MRIVMLDKPIYAFAVEDEEGSVGFDEAELDNIRIWVNGCRVVIRLGNDTPDDRTRQLLLGNRD